MKPSTAFETVDLSQLALPKDEPLSTPIIMAHAALARAVIDRALEDLSSNDEITKRTAIRFCLSKDKADQDDREFWLAWLDTNSDELARNARQRLDKAANAEPTATRRSRVLLKGEALPLRRSRPKQPEGLSYRA